MQFSLDHRTATLGVGEFSEFALGPRDAAGGPQGLWRAQLGTHWHRELRTRTAGENPAATFEVAIEGRVAHRGWILSLAGRIDQLIPEGGGRILREIKTVTRPLPAPEAELRAAYPAYFVQLATYLALLRLAPEPGARQLSVGVPARFPTETAGTRQPIVDTPRGALRGELLFVEAGSGLSQAVALTPADDGLFQARLEAVAEFLTARQRARERLRGLRFRPAFATLRSGQETTRTDLSAALQRARAPVFFEAPTGFGKTGVLLECALDLLRTGHLERLVYLTSKSTGQLQVVRTLEAMTAGNVTSGTQELRNNPPSRDPASLSSRFPSPSDSPPPGPAPISNFKSQISNPATPPRGVAVWQVRSKSEHCVNEVFHCVRESCRYLDGIGERWAASGLARFHLDESAARDLESLRAAGRHALVCPYEITRTALAFQDVWIGDYNYVFSPRHAGLFGGQPGYDPARTLLVVDEAHNLPSRAADAFSHGFTALAAAATAAELRHAHAPQRLQQAWNAWTHFLETRAPCEALALGDEDEARHLVSEITAELNGAPLDYAALAPAAAGALWEIGALAEDLAGVTLPRLWWSPRAGELAITCLDAAEAIGPVLRGFGGVVLASATFGPADTFAAACGLEQPPELPPPAPPELPEQERLGALNKRETRKLFAQLTSAAALLKVEEAAASSVPETVRAATPWREGAYTVAYDARVDTTFQHRLRHYPLTAATVADLRRASVAPVAVFFPSYAYAEAIQRELATAAPGLRVVLQPRQSGLAAQAAWVEASLTGADALFLVLGSSFSEGIDQLGGRVTHAMVVGPALPEVNAVQHARMEEFRSLGRDAAFRRVYQVPGMTKVNQALGRLVRAPGQRAKVLLHCRRFAAPGYHELLAPDYQDGTVIADDLTFASWLGH
jgi:Rad3-related DNA helicase